jgi:hypothetical protein
MAFSGSSTLEEWVMRTDIDPCTRLSEICTEKLLRNQLIDRIQSFKNKSSSHPLGFRKLNLIFNSDAPTQSPGLRLHLWESNPSLETPHHHAWDMTVMTVMGQIENEIFEKQNTLPPSHREMQRHYGHPLEYGSPELQVEEKMGALVSLQSSGVTYYAKGQIYSQSPQTIHVSRFDINIPTVTLMLRSRFAKWAPHYVPLATPQKTTQTAVIRPRLNDVCDALRAM